MAVLDTLVTQALKTVFKKTGATVATRRGVNFIDSSLVATTVADDAVNDAVNVTPSIIVPADTTKFLRGDGTWSVPPAPAAGSMTTIFDTVLGGTQATVDSNTILGGNIPGTYRHLRLVVSGRANLAASSELLAVQFNGDTAANYDCQEGRFNASAAASGETLGNAVGFLGRVAAASAPAGLGSPLTIDILDYASTTFNKTWLSHYFLKIGTATTNLTSGVFHGAWRNSAAITRIVVLPNASSLVAGTRVTLYGLT